MASPLWPLFLTFIVSLSLTMDSLLFCNADPTDAFTPLPFSKTNIVLQKPYDLPLAKRYSYVDGVHYLRVSSTDKPFKPDSPTGPRTEIRIQFEGYVFVTRETSGASIMQVHRSDGRKPATDLMLMIFDGELRFYSGKVVESNFYEKWFKVNVNNDVGANRLVIFIDNFKKLEVEGKGASRFYFKCGVYAQHGSSPDMESRWKNIRIYKKNS